MCCGSTRAIASTSSTGRRIATGSSGSTSVSSTGRLASPRIERSLAAGVELTYTIDAGPETHVRVNGDVASQQRARGNPDRLDAVGVRRIPDRRGRRRSSGVSSPCRPAYQPMLEVKVEGDESVRTLVIDVTPSPAGRAHRSAFRRCRRWSEVGAARSARAIGTSAVQALTNPREYERTVLAVLHSMGYPQATVTVGVPIFEETMASVPVTVNAGPQFRIGDVSFERANERRAGGPACRSRPREGRAVSRRGRGERARCDCRRGIGAKGSRRRRSRRAKTFAPSDGAVDVIFVGQGGPASGHPGDHDLRPAVGQRRRGQANRAPEGRRRPPHGRLARCPAPPVREWSLQTRRYRGRTARGSGRYRARQASREWSRSGRRCACATASRSLKSGPKRTSKDAISCPACRRT